MKGRKTMYPTAIQTDDQALAQRIVDEFLSIVAEGAKTFG
jgi:hypothetical protein